MLSIIPINASEQIAYDGIKVLDICNLKLQTDKIKS